MRLYVDTISMEGNLTLSNKITKAHPFDLAFLLLGITQRYTSLKYLENGVCKGYSLQCCLFIKRLKTT